MSIERNRWGFDGEITFVCDDCGEELHTDEAAFPVALSVLKKEQWANIKNKGDYEHYCPACASEFREDG